MTVKITPRGITALREVDGIWATVRDLQPVDYLRVQAEVEPGVIISNIFDAVDQHDDLCRLLSAYCRCDTHAIHQRARDVVQPIWIDSIKPGFDPSDVISEGVIRQDCLQEVLADRILIETECSALSDDAERFHLCFGIAAMIGSADNPIQHSLHITPNQFGFFCSLELVVKRDCSVMEGEELLVNCEASYELWEILTALYDPLGKPYENEEWSPRDKESFEELARRFRDQESL